MKSDFRLQASHLRLIAIFTFALIGFASSSFALTEANPYVAISGRNVFALKPPPPLTPLIDPAKNTPPPNLELQGFTTILGRPQVLIKLKIPPRPPEPAKDRSLVMDVGQREGDVEVVEMDAYAGTVKLKNMGNLVSLNLKENSAKPAAGPALPSPSMPSAVPPGIPTPAGVGGVVPPPSGGGMTLPTRSLRSGDSPVPAAPLTGGGTPYQQQTPEAVAQKMEANVALYEANRLKNEELIKAGARIPRMPVHSLLKSSPPTDQ